MGDLLADTELERLDQTTFSIMLSRDWEIWGPNGGYIAAIALRAAASTRSRPASIVGHFLSVASFDEPLRATTHILRSSRHATSVQVVLSQGDRAVFSALVWGVDNELDGLTHRHLQAPEVAGWNGLPSTEERFAALGRTGPPYPFWNNFDQRAPEWDDDWETLAPGSHAPVWRNWMRFIESTASDAWQVGALLTVLVDIGGWPAASATHRNSGFVAPSIDLTVSFHQLLPTTWFLVDSVADGASGGLIATRSSVFDDNGQVLATGTGQLLCRRIPT
jgi:acyl-CoA thioesterase